MKREISSPNNPSIFRLILSPVRENLVNLKIIRFHFLTFTYRIFFFLFFSFLKSLYRPLPETLSSPFILPFLHFPRIRKRERISLDRVASRATDIIANEITPSCESYSTLSTLCILVSCTFARNGNTYRYDRRAREREREELNFIG